LSIAIGTGFTIPSGVETFECSTIQFRRVHGRVVNNKGEPISKVGIVLENGDVLVTGKDGEFHLWLNPAQEYFGLTFNPDNTKVVHRPDGTLAIFPLPGNAAKYDSKVVELSGKNFPDGTIPDIVLPLRDGEEK
jgi:hypothetical protein